MSGDSFFGKKMLQKKPGCFFLTIANKYPFCLSEVCFIFRFVSYPTPPSRFEPPPQAWRSSLIQH